MRSKKSLYWSCLLLCLGLAFSAWASVCYLPEGCEAELNGYEYSIESVYCVPNNGYYKEENKPAGYTCHEVTSGCVGYVKCEPNDCIKLGYDYVGEKVDEDAWEYYSCPNNGDDSSTLFYRREAKDCEAGFSVDVTEENCSDEETYIVADYKSGDKNCGKCEVVPDDCHDKFGMYSANKLPRGCYTCESQTMLIPRQSNRPGQLLQPKRVTCYECTERDDMVQVLSECVDHSGEKQVMADGKTECYLKADIYYKTANEVGCHREFYNAQNCSCEGEEDGCPAGYFKEIYGDCPSGAIFAKASDESRCLSCVMMRCSSDDNISVSSYGVKKFASVSPFAADDDEEQLNASETVKRTYVNDNGKICTKTCVKDDCEEVCQSVSQIGVKRVSPRNPEIDDTEPSCWGESVWAN